MTEPVKPPPLTRDEASILLDQLPNPNKVAEDRHKYTQDYIDEYRLAHAALLLIAVTAE